VLKQQNMRHVYRFSLQVENVWQYPLSWIWNSCQNHSATVDIPAGKPPGNESVKASSFDDFMWAEKTSYELLTRFIHSGFKDKKFSWNSRSSNNGLLTIHRYIHWWRNCGFEWGGCIAIRLFPIPTTLQCSLGGWVPILTSKRRRKFIFNFDTNLIFTKQKRVF